MYEMDKEILEYDVKVVEKTKDEQIFASQNSPKITLVILVMI